MKKPFYKNLWLYLLLIFILGIAALFLIPYGLNGRSIGNQLLDTAQQAKELYVYDEKEHWSEEEWNEYWKKNPEHTAVVSDRTDWEALSDSVDPNDPQLNELPPDYSKLWGVDFHDLETTEQYSAWYDVPMKDIEGNPLPEEYIYREKSTGNLIVDVTLDGFILKLGPDYRAEWGYREDSDPQGFRKFKKGLNLKLAKKLGENKICRIEIAPHDYGGPHKDEHLEHPEYKLTMRRSFTLDDPESPWRFLRVILDHTPYNTDTYTIQIDSVSPKECFEANLELEVLEGMTFTPPELKEKYLGSVNRFPLPQDWPHPDEAEFLKIKNDLEGGRVVEHEEFGIRVDLEPEWEVKTYGPESMHEHGHDFRILASNACAAFFSKSLSPTLEEWLEINKAGHERGLGWATYKEVKPYEDFPFKAYELLHRELTGSDADPQYEADSISKRIVYEFNEKIIEAGVGFKNTFSDIPISEGQCEDFYTRVINSIHPLN